MVEFLAPERLVANRTGEAGVMEEGIQGVGDLVVIEDGLEAFPAFAHDFGRGDGRCSGEGFVEVRRKVAVIGVVVELEIFGDCLSLVRGRTVVINEDFPL